MALTKIEHDDILKKIAESGGETVDMLDDIQKLRDDFDEREGMENLSDVGGEKWKEKYEELRKKYIDRFFATPAEAEKEMKEAKKETKEDVKKDSENLSFDDLFKKREG